MIFDFQKVRTPATSSGFQLKTRPRLQRKCACGGTPGPTGECAECKRKRLALQPKLAINQPGDQSEQEADRVAEAVVGGTASNRPSITSLGSVGAVQREEPKFNAEYKPKTEEEKYKEAAKKVGEAFLKTPPGEEIEKKAEEFGDAFISTLPGKIITGAAVAGAVATLAATRKELPIGIPEIPLDKIKPGLKMKITYEGPVDKPTKVMATFSFSFGGRGKSSEKKPKLTESEKRARKAAELRLELRTPEEKAAEERIIASRMLRPDQLTPRPSPLSFGVAGEQLGFHPGVPASATRASSPWSPDLGLTSEAPVTAQAVEEPKKKEEETLQRKAANNYEVSGAPPIVDEVLQSPSRQLDTGTREFMERRFGHNFGAVRIHTDARAAESARAIDARAFTVGRDIVFAAGQFAPGSSSGQRLLAHELAHVIQQREVTNASGFDSVGNLAFSVVQRKRPREFDEPAGDRSYEGPRFTRRRSACLEPNTFAVATTVGPNDQNQAQGFLKIDFRDRGRTRWKGGKQHYFGSGGREKMDDKICDCDCMLYRQFLRGVVFQREEATGSFQQVLKMKSGSEWDFSVDANWREEGALKHSRRCGSEATWHGCKRQYCDEPGYDKIRQGLGVLLRFNFLFQIWDRCEQKFVREEKRTLTIAGDTPPRAIKWDQGWLALNQKNIRALTPVAGQQAGAQTQTGTVQKKLAIAKPGDRFEEQADRAAQMLLSGDAGPHLSAVHSYSKPNEQMSGVAPKGVHEVLRSNGQPLGPATKATMSKHFGYNFELVRVHTDARAAESARAVNAHAYTVGSHIVFAQGEYSPGTSRGQRLLAHELAHVVQQREAEPFVQRETYYGGGYKQRAFASLDAEIAAGQKKPTEWHPATPDMAATAAGSGGGESVSTLDELLTKLEAKGKGSVTRLNLVGHSNSSVFSFGGTITKDDVEFSPDAAIYDEALTKSAKRIAALRDRFAEGAKIVLYSCDAGTGQALLDAVGSAFGVCVEGFTSEIWWCLTKKDGKVVRGHVWAQNPNDPLPPEQPPDCETLSSNIATLTTGGKSKQCGAKKAAP